MTLNQELGNYKEQLKKCQPMVDALQSKGEQIAVGIKILNSKMELIKAGVKVPSSVLEVGLQRDVNLVFDCKL